jgi:hypothetical protein
MTEDSEPVQDFDNQTGIDLISALVVAINHDDAGQMNEEELLTSLL